MKSILTLLLQVPVVLTTIAQADTTWHKGGIGGLNFNQVALSNWAAGGESSMALGIISNLYANYADSIKTWDNTLDLGYGFIRSGGSPIRKNDDRIDLLSRFGRKAFTEKLRYAALLNFKSQFAPGYAYPDDSTVISRFLAPGYIIASLGMDWKPTDYMSLFLSPATGKTTLVVDQDLADVGAYGVERAEYDTSGSKIKDGRMVRGEFGAYFNFNFNKPIWENVNLYTRLTLFSNYADHPENIDVNWDMLIGMKINKFLAATISTTLIYDHDVPVPIYEEVNGVKMKVGTGPRTQFKEVFALGLSYKFDHYSVREP
jgi:hypothetical protein